MNRCMYVYIKAETFMSALQKKSFYLTFPVFSVLKAKTISDFEEFRKNGKKKLEQTHQVSMFNFVIYTSISSFCAIEKQLH